MKCPAILFLLASSAWFLVTNACLEQGSAELAKDMFTMGGSTLILLAAVFLLRNSEFYLASSPEKQEQDPSAPNSSISPAHLELFGRPGPEQPCAEVYEDSPPETDVTGYWAGAIICLALVLGSVLGLLASSQNVAAIFTALAGIAGLTAGVWFKT